MTAPTCFLSQVLLLATCFAMFMKYSSHVALAIFNQGFLSYYYILLLSRLHPKNPIGVAIGSLRICFCDVRFPPVRNIPFRMALERVIKRSHARTKFGTHS